MSLRHYLLFMFLGTVLCTIALGLVMRASDPATAPWFIFAFFYASLFLSLLGGFSVAGMLWHLWRRHQSALIFRHLRKTFRQGVLFSSLLTGALFLRGQGLLSWLTALVLLLCVTVIESILLSSSYSPER